MYKKELIVLMAKRNYFNLCDSPKLNYNTEQVHHKVWTEV